MPFQTDPKQPMMEQSRIPVPIVRPQTTYVVNNNHTHTHTHTHTHIGTVEILSSPRKPIHCPSRCGGGGGGGGEVWWTHGVTESADTKDPKR